MNKKLTMKDIQKVSLDILKKVKEICEKENLRYYIAYGTLIGVIRHEGFIPWDDDIDLLMPRPDYEKLIEYFSKHKEELAPLELFDPRYNEQYPYAIGRVSNSDYYLKVQNEKQYGMGVFVDIYPMDGMSNEYKIAKKLKNKSSFYSALCYLSTREKCEKDNTKSKLKLIIKKPVFWFSKMLGRNFLIKKLYKNALKYDYDESSYVGCLVWGSDEGLNGCFPKSWFGNGIKKNFEGEEFLIPREYDKFLKQQYGDYMQLPPKEEQIGHHYYDAYKK